MKRIKEQISKETRRFEEALFLFLRSTFKNKKTVPTTSIRLMTASSPC